MKEKKREKIGYEIYKIIHEALPVDKLGRDLATPLASEIVNLLIVNKVL